MSYTCYKYKTHLGQLQENACGANSYTLISSLRFNITMTIRDDTIINILNWIFHENKKCPFGPLFIPSQVIKMHNRPSLTFL